MVLTLAFVIPFESGDESHQSLFVYKGYPFDFQHLHSYLMQVRNVIVALIEQAKIAFALLSSGPMTGFLLTDLRDASWAFPKSSVNFCLLLMVTVDNCGGNLISD